MKRTLLFLGLLAASCNSRGFLEDGRDGGGGSGGNGGNCKPSDCGDLPGRGAFCQGVEQQSCTAEGSGVCHWKFTCTPADGGATCAGAPPLCGSLSPCGDVVVQAACRDGQWTCPPNTGIPAAPPPGCSCGPRGWLCADAGQDTRPDTRPDTQQVEARPDTRPDTHADR